MLQKQKDIHFRVAEPRQFLKFCDKQESVNINTKEWKRGPPSTLLQHNEKCLYKMLVNEIKRLCGRLSTCTATRATTCNMSTYVCINE